ncbi:MAG: RNA methyltransferase [Clostridia bacterium]
MEIITSTKNQFVREAKSLADKKFRDNTGLFLVEGINIFKDIPSCQEIEYILAVEEKADELSALTALSQAKIYYVTGSVLEYIADTVSPYGIVAVCRKPKTSFCLPTGNALLLDGVSDPGNLGTIIRTAAATGFNEIYTLDCADIYSPKVVRATLGALFRVKIVAVNLDEALNLIENTKSIALDMSGENLLTSKLGSPILLVAGSEAHGIRAGIRDKVNQTKSLPMQNGIESLNVAVALAVAMYQAI